MLTRKGPPAGQRQAPGQGRIASSMANTNNIITTLLVVFTVVMALLAIGLFILGITYAFLTLSNGISSAPAVANNKLVFAQDVLVAAGSSSVALLVLQSWFGMLNERRATPTASLQNVLIMEDSYVADNFNRLIFGIGVRLTNVGSRAAAIEAMEVGVAPGAQQPDDAKVTRRVARNGAYYLAPGNSIVCEITGNYNAFLDACGCEAPREPLENPFEKKYFPDLLLKLWVFDPLTNSVYQEEFTFSVWEALQRFLDAHEVDSAKQQLQYMVFRDVPRVAAP